MLLLGRSAMSANRVSRSRSGLNDGAAEPLRSLSTCMRVPSQPMHMHCCYPSLQRAAALYYLSTMRAEPFFPASSIHFLSHFASDPQLRSSFPSPNQPSSLSLSLPPPTLRDFARIQRKEREREPPFAKTVPSELLAPVSPFSSILTRSRGN